MTASTLAEWLRERMLGVPPAFRPWVQPRRAESAATPHALVEEARDHLAAIGHEGDRADAFHLLAADGFATWACERALDDDDPATTLRALVDALIE